VVSRRDAYAMLLRMSVFPLYVRILLLEVRDERKVYGTTLRLAAVSQPLLCGRPARCICYVTAYECFPPLCMDALNGGP